MGQSIGAEERVGHAARMRIILGVVRAALPDDRLRLRFVRHPALYALRDVESIPGDTELDAALDESATATLRRARDSVVSEPHAGEIRLAIRCSRRGRRQVRLAVRQT